MPDKNQALIGIISLGVALGLPELLQSFSINLGYYPVIIIQIGLIMYGVVSLIW
jgi:hypothetical protein